MSLSLRDRRMLRGIGKALHRDDPRLASMLATFARLTDGEAMPGREQDVTPPAGCGPALHLAATGTAA